MNNEQEKAMEMQDYIDKIGNECFVIEGNRITRHKIGTIRIAVDKNGVKSTEYGVYENDYNMNLGRETYRIVYHNSDKVYLDKNDIIKDI